ncbi:uncharacterized protein LOC133173154 [Saccostrea echinata]|uniref:uncharacterized protein LOC133173154 n=1 Tax=Saccostrea echinata TaxID=191078 RepID=UPI002A828CDB|nr:uncharacterized protein LOC133173154 [Saccostrea echinata]
MEEGHDSTEEIFKEGRLYLDKNRELLEQKILNLDADTCHRDHGWKEYGTKFRGTDFGEDPRERIQCLTEKSKHAPRTFLQANDTSDLRLSVEGKSLYVSRILLSIVSPVLKEIFDKRSKDQAIIEIPLPGKKYSDILEFLECIYPDKLKPISDDNVSLMLRMADEFEVKTLRERCVSFLTLQLQNNCSSDKILEILTMSIDYNLEELHKLSIDMASRTSSDNLENVPGFSELSDDITSAIFHKRLKLFEDAGRKIRKRLKEAETHCSLYHKNERWGDNLCNKCLAGVGKVSSYEIEKLF